MRDLILSLVAAVRALLEPRRSRHTVIVVVPPPRTDPWARPWTSPGRAEARNILRQRSAAPRRVIIAPDGVHFEQPVAVRAARPGPAWTWIR
ncbi:hypothetical protein AB0G74_19555 [Streptomyces sp. NPDC020875]|uniref:hypothetical protein n=1 Tax=Streptomyces sp. NPDC020875 TaxID=3154898 RepID=UPI0033FC36D2